MITLLQPTYNLNTIIIVLKLHVNHQDNNNIFLQCLNINQCMEEEVIIPLINKVIILPYLLQPDEAINLFLRLQHTCHITPHQAHHHHLAVTGRMHNTSIHYISSIFTKNLIYKRKEFMAGKRSYREFKSRVLFTTEVQKFPYIHFILSRTTSNIQYTGRGKAVLYKFDI